jgi:hypothetical protein
MRLVRTETYYLWSEIKGRFYEARKYDPGLSVVWIATHTNRRIEFSEIQGLADLTVFQRDDGEFNEYLTGRFIDLSLRGARMDTRKQFELDVQNFGTSMTLHRGLGKRTLRAERRGISNPGLVDELLNELIVIERSPAESLPLRSVLGGNAFIAVGTWVGFHSGADGWVLFVSVPGGVILMGAAIGISRGLMSGLHRAVEKAINNFLERE